MSTALVGENRGGMGSLPHEACVAFRVWAPHADAVYVTGSFNEWSPDAHPMTKEGGGYWYADIPSGAGLNTFHQNQADNVIAYHRWHQGGPGDDVVVVVNLSHQAHENYKLGFPSPGTWRLRLNSDWNGYSRAFGNQACSDVLAGAQQQDGPQGAPPQPRDGFPAAGTLSIGPYSVLIFSQDP